MRWLSILRNARRVRRDRGGVATIVAILVGGGVILGAAALTIDVGNVMWERRQLQNGADAVALAVAKSCAQGPCNPTTAANRAGLNNANAADGRNGLDSATYAHGVCGHNVPGLPTCAPVNNTLWDCPPVPSTVTGSVPYVEVRTSTVTGSGGTVLPPLVAQTMGFSGEKITACSRAAWGNPGAYQASAPITFSYCEWKAITGANASGAGANYNPAPAAGATPGYGGAGQPAWPAGSTEKVLFLATQTGATPCPTWNGHDVPGGFGYLNSNGCVTIVTTGDWAKIDTGNSAPCDLSALRGHVVDLPIFDCTVTSGNQPTQTVDQLLAAGQTCAAGGGNNTWYHLAGWAKFYVTGMKLSGSTVTSVNPNNPFPGGNPCTGGQRCLSGWFVQGTINARTIVPGNGTPNFGTVAVIPAG